MAGVLSVETCGNIFAPTSRKASSNYGIGSDGRIALYVDEANRAWTSSNAGNDHQAVTIEVSNSSNGGEWPVSDYVLSRLIDLCVDICQRNGIDRLNFTGDASGNLTAHKYFANTSCPGPYLYSKFPYIADEVNKRLHPTAVIDPKTYDVIVPVPVFYTPDNAINHIDQRNTYQPGKYFVFTEAKGMINITKTQGVPGGWMNPSDNVIMPLEPPVVEEPIIIPVEPQTPIEVEIPKKEQNIEEDKPVEVINSKLSWFKEIGPIISNLIKNIIEILLKGGRK
jgi:hypothetical protein